MNRIVLLAAVMLSVLLPGPASAQQTYTIQDAYRSAIEANESVRISGENLVQAESRIDQAMSYFYPRLTGQAAYTQYNEVLPSGETGGFIFQPLGQTQASITLHQPLYTGGRTLAALRTTRLLSESSARGLSSTKQDTLLSAATAYYGVLKAEQMVEKSRDSVDRMERHKQVTEREASTRRTKANMSNLLRARTLVSQARIMLTRDETDLRIARQQLFLVTRLPEGAVLSAPAPQREPSESLEQLKKLAFENRDDLAVSRLSQKVAEENVTIVRGAHYPQLYAEGAIQYLDSHPTTMLDGTTYYGGIHLQIPLFEGGLMKAELSEAKSKQRQAELSQQYLERAVETEVYDAYVNFQTVSSVLAAVEVQYQDAQSNFATIESLFAQGLVESLALIDAQQALFLAERELVAATFERQLAILRLKRSIGTLGRES